MINWEGGKEGGRGRVKELAELMKNCLLQLSMHNKIQKPSALLLQLKCCKNDAHHDTLACRGEVGEGGVGRV